MEEGSKVRKRDNSESGDFVIVKQGDNSTTEAQDSDTSFEELHVDKATREDTVNSDPVEPESMVIVNDVDIDEKSVTNPESNSKADNNEASGNEEEDEVNLSCHDNVRQVLDDIEAQIEKLREAVTKLSGDKLSLMEVLDSVSQGLPGPGTELSEVEREEIGLEVRRLRARAEDVRCDLVTRCGADRHDTRADMGLIFPGGRSSRSRPGR